MKEELKRFLLERLESFPARSTARTQASALTVGVEHEFFLIAPGGEPVSHEQGQAFLCELAKDSDWYIREQEPGFVQRVSLDDDQGRFTAVKYDHHPHLFEIAFAYENDLHRLNRQVEETLRAVTRAAEMVGAKVSNNANLSLSASDPRVVSDRPEYQALRHYRSLLLRRRNQSVDPEFANYAAVIAATQTHIGGTSWWKSPELISRLYALEPALLAWTSALALEPGVSIEELLKFRWRGYDAVFQGHPLVGFPDLEGWTLDAWCEALLDSPLAGGPSDPWAGLCMKSYPENPFENWSEFISAVRDLQIIRPKLFGTLEFRADPAQRGAREILAVAALRLGLTHSQLSQDGPVPSIGEARRKWWDAVRSGVVAQDPAPLEQARRGLQARALGEEIYLSAFFPGKG
jgi:hypothetical protein